MNLRPIEDANLIGQGNLPIPNNEDVTERPTLYFNDALKLGKLTTVFH